MDNKFPTTEQFKKLNFRRDAYYMMRDRICDTWAKLTFDSIDQKTEELFAVLETSWLVDDIVKRAPSMGNGKLDVDEYVGLSGNPLINVIEKIREYNQEKDIKWVHPFSFSRTPEAKTYITDLMPTIKENCKRSLDTILRN